MSRPKKRIAQTKEANFSPQRLALKLADVLQTAEELANQLPAEAELQPSGNAISLQEKDTLIFTIIRARSACNNALRTLKVIE